MSTWRYLRKLEEPMDLEVADLENGITKVTLSGRFDVEGALKIDGEFNAIAEQKKKLLVDLFFRDLYCVAWDPHVDHGS
jgi:hypothetical protein